MHPTKILDLFSGIKEDWVQDNVILLGPAGSRAYGTATENSDHDYRGIVVPPIEYHLGLESFSEYNNTSGKTYKNTKDDVDVHISHLSRFVGRCVNGSATDIDLLFLPTESYLMMTEEGERLVDARDFFVTKRTAYVFASAANESRRQMERTHQKTNGENYGFKNLYQAIRLLSAAINMLENHTHRMPSNDEIPLLIACKKGNFSYQKALIMIAQLEEVFIKARKYSTLPEEANREFINSLLVDLNSSALGIQS